MDGDKRKGGVRVYNQPKNAAHSLPVWAIAAIIVLGLLSAGFTLYWVFS